MMHLDVKTSWKISERKDFLNKFLQLMQAVNHLKNGSTI